jgi:hypothetical protein
VGQPVSFEIALNATGDTSRVAFDYLEFSPEGPSIYPPQLNTGSLVYSATFASGGSHSAEFRLYNKYFTGNRATCDETFMIIDPNEIGLNKQ